MSCLCGLGTPQTHSPLPVREAFYDPEAESGNTFEMRLRRNSTKDLSQKGRDGATTEKGVEESKETKEVGAFKKFKCRAARISCRILQDILLTLLVLNTACLLLLYKRILWINVKMAWMTIIKEFII
jgi:hypothetical protein